MTSVMYSTSSWRADGLRWLAEVLTQAADALERSDAPPAELQPDCPSAACDEVRSRGRYRAPYY